MKTTTEAINQIAAKTQPDYDAFWNVFVNHVGGYYHYEHPETMQRVGDLIEDWINKTATVPPVTVHTILNEYDGSWYHSVSVIYLNGVLNGVFEKRYKYDDKLAWRNEIASMETISAMLDMFKEAVKWATTQSEEDEQWLEKCLIDFGLELTTKSKTNKAET